MIPRLLDYSIGQVWQSSDCSVFVIFVLAAIIVLVIFLGLG